MVAITALASVVVAACVFPLPNTRAGAVKDLLIIGHKGTNHHAAANTMKAFKRAARYAEVIETDVQITRDGAMVIFHDKTLDDATTCTGRVADKTYAEMRRCRTADGAPVPGFGELLRWITTTQLTLVAEMKLHGWSLAQARAYGQLVRRWGMLDRTIASSFHTDDLATMKAANPTIRTALIFSFDVPRLDAQLAAGGTSMPWIKSITASDVRQQHAAGMQVWCWTARSAAQYRRAVDLGVDGIVVDDPKAARRWLDGYLAVDGPRGSRRH